MGLDTRNFIQSRKRIYLCTNLGLSNIILAVAAYWSCFLHLGSYLFTDRSAVFVIRSMTQIR